MRFRLALLALIAASMTVGHAQLRVPLASAATINTRNPAMAIGSQTRILGLKKKGGRFEFAAVATVTVALAVVLEVKSITFELSGLPVVIEQAVSGAVVEQDRKTRPLPIASPIMRVLLFPAVAPAFTVMDGGFPIVGACMGAA